MTRFSRRERAAGWTIIASRARSFSTTCSASGRWTLTTTGCPSAIRARCTWAIGAGGKRLGLDRGEDVLPGHGELTLHHRHDLGLGHRRHVGLQRRQLGDVLLGDQVRASGEDLAELAEGRAELARTPRAGAAGPPDRPRDAAAVPESWRTPTGPRTRAISRARPFSAPGVGRPLGQRLPGGGVDDHDRALGEVSDPVGDVAEQELLAASHPGAADTTTSASARRAASRIAAAMSSSDSTTARAAIPSAGSERSRSRLEPTRRSAGAAGRRRPPLGAFAAGDDLDREQLGVRRVREARRPLDRKRTRRRCRRSPLRPVSSRRPSTEHRSGPGSVP